MKGQVYIKNNKIILEFDKNSFERLANLMGWFNPEFLKLLKKSKKQAKRKEIEELDKFLENV
mgnify:CR=1 FL=1